MQTSENISTPQDVHFDDTLAATRGRSNYYFSFATWPIGVGTSRAQPASPRCVPKSVGHLIAVISERGPHQLMTSSSLDCHRLVEWEDTVSLRHQWWGPPAPTFWDHCLIAATRILLFYSLLPIEILSPYHLLGKGLDVLPGLLRLEHDRDHLRWVQHSPPSIQAPFTRPSYRRQKVCYASSTGEPQ